MRLAGVVILAAACGSTSPATAPRPPSSGPSCAAVADHLVALAAADNRTAPSPDLGTAIHREADRQCTATPWSPARRACLATAASQDETLSCPEH